MVLLLSLLRFPAVTCACNRQKIHKLPDDLLHALNVLSLAACRTQAPHTTRTVCVLCVSNTLHAFGAAEPTCSAAAPASTSPRCDCRRHVAAATNTKNACNPDTGH
jgi:hypothetical protein